MNQNFQAIVDAVEAAKVEAEKFFGEKANAQAGKRLRAHYATIASLCKAGRKEVSEVKAARKTTA
jgi:hypothetical protein